MKTESCDGTTYNALATLRDDQLCQGTTYNAVLMVRGDQICEGTTYNAVVTTRGGYGLSNAELAAVLYFLRRV